MSLRSSFDRVVSHPMIYRVQTRLLGRRILDERMQEAITSVAPPASRGIVVDVGGGTAATRDLWPSSWTYISVDPDERMVDLSSSKEVIRHVGSADSVPLPDRSADVVVLQNMSHHLDHKTWGMALQEAHRILHVDGRLIFMDAYFDRRRVISRLFWRLDAGHFPRTRTDLENSISSKFDVLSVSQFTLIHHVLIMIGAPR